MNQTHQSSLKPGEQFTCERHPKKPLTDIDLCSRCGYRQSCDEFMAAMDRLDATAGSSGDQPAAAPDTGPEPNPGRPRVKRSLMPRLRSGLSEQQVESIKSAIQLLTTVLEAAEKKK